MLEDLKIDRKGYLGVSGQIVEHFRSKILNEQLRPGDRLPTSREIIREIGVSTQAVSDAISVLSKEGLVRATRRGTYVRPDLHLRHSFDEMPVGDNSKTDDFALIVPNMRTYHYGVIAEGILSEMTRQNENRHLTIFASHDDADKQSSIILQIIVRQFAGVIISPPVEDDMPSTHLIVLRRNKIPVVFLHRDVAGIAAPLMTQSAEDVGRLVGEAFVAHGHRRVGYFGALRYSTAEAYEVSLRQTLERHGACLPEHLVFYGPSPKKYTDESEVAQIKQEGIKRMLQHPDRPTAIFCNDGSAEMLLYVTAQSLGLRVPEDLSIVRFGKEPHDCIISNRITSVDIDWHNAGIRISHILSEICEGKREIDNDEVFYMPLSLSNGVTLGAVPDR